MNKSIYLILVLMLILTSCSTRTMPITNQDFYQEGEPITPKSFKSADEVNQFVSSNVQTYNTRDMMLTSDMAIESSGAMTKSLEYSTTNVQVESIDEGDIIKTDGNHIYTITGNTLFIIQAYPGEESKILSQYKFENQPTGLFIKEDKALVYGTITNYENIDESILPGTQLTFTQLFDISDRENINLISEKVFEGYPTTSRMKDDEVYIITTSYSFAHPLPIYIDGGVVRDVSPRKMYYYNMPYSSTSFAGIQSININTGDLVDQKIIATQSGTEIYVSENNIYLASTEYINEWEISREITKKLIQPKLTAKDSELISKINLIESDVLSNYEKEQKIYQIYSNAILRLSREQQEQIQEQIQKETYEELERLEYRTFTTINKINLANGNLILDNSVKIPGRINNQFSMDEFDQILRVTTTIDQVWMKDETKPSENHIYTITPKMEIMQSLKGIAKTETIYSSRFIENKLYLVTFRQVDPFFVFDLSKGEIKELGQLKIPGYSRYLHPYDENHLIGIGRDSTDEGRVEGLKISLFDVSNPQNPIEKAKYVSDQKYSSSTAEYEHKAFLFSKEKELLVIPMYSYDYQTNENYNGAFVFKINEEEITLRGLIDHSSGVQNYYGSGVERSLYIEDELYTKSPSLLRINSLDDLSSIKALILKEETTGDIPVY
jgi:inhibitor of cysteine peptidase